MTPFYITTIIKFQKTNSKAFDLQIKSGARSLKLAICSMQLLMRIMCDVVVGLRFAYLQLMEICCSLNISLIPRVSIDSRTDGL